MTKYIAIFIFNSVCKFVWIASDLRNVDVIVFLSFMKLSVVLKLCTYVPSRGHTFQCIFLTSRTTTENWMTWTVCIQNCGKNQTLRSQTNQCPVGTIYQPTFGNNLSYWSWPDTPLTHDLDQNILLSSQGVLLLNIDSDHPPSQIQCFIVLLDFLSPFLSFTFVFL